MYIALRNYSYTTPSPYYPDSCTTEHDTEVLKFKDRDALLEFLGRRSNSIKDYEIYECNPVEIETKLSISVK